MKLDILDRNNAQTSLWNPEGTDIFLKGFVWIKDMGIFKIVYLRKRTGFVYMEMYSSWQIEISIKKQETALMKAS